MRGGVQLIIAFCCCIGIVYTIRCVRIPEGIPSAKTPGDGRFSLMISGYPDKYVPSTAYTVSIQGPRNVHVPAKFIGFSLLVESTNPRTGDGREAEAQLVGSLQLFADALVKHSEKCPNMVTHTSSIPKTEIQVRWIAPPAGSGCVVFKATVIEDRTVWFQDDGPLTKTLCEDIQENLDTQPDVLEECCACNEAKYEVAFEGMWSRHTHPKDFPSNSWLTRFSDVIGASHTIHYRFWEYGATATDGLRQVAERGSTRMLESELKSHSQDIRTIIKARGISFPNVTGKTFAVFRVDRQHHLMSLVSMIDPSPDWIVGVSGLELCLKNCSWIESKVLNLYPWDAGTDSGITYISPDMQTVPRDIIRRITSSFPNDIRSPFFDPSGEEMKPLARLHLTRQRIYPQKCEDLIDFTMPVGSECSVGEWGEWSECSVTCGKGNRKRQRFYLHPDKVNEYGCKKTLTHRATCYGGPCPPEPPAEPTEDPICALTEWSDWSRCSVSCGRGTRNRYRTLQSKLKSAWKYCRSRGLAETQQTDECYLKTYLCPNAHNSDSPDTLSTEATCQMTDWSDWSPCNATCASHTGLQVRTRQLLRYTGILETTTFSEDNEGEDDIETEGEKKEEGNESGENKEELCPEISRIEEAPCNVSKQCIFTPTELKVICQMPKEEGPCNLQLKRYFFDVTAQDCREFSWSSCRGNQNNFDTLEECESKCGSYKQTTEEENTTPVTNYPGLSSGSLMEGTDKPPVDCKLSRWTKWSRCSATCGKAYKFRSRSILVHNRNGGKACSLYKTFRKKKCRKLPRCQDNVRPEEGGNDNECAYTDWTDWSQCTATCGSNAFQQRTRSVDRTVPGAECNDRIMTRACPVLPCKV